MRRGAIFLLLVFPLPLLGCPADPASGPSDDVADTADPTRDAPEETTQGPPDDIATAPDAGPLSGCDRYCQGALSLCEDLFSTDDACQSACAALDDTGTDGDTTGDTLACRQTYLDQLAAAPDRGALYCPLIAAEGSPSCEAPTASCATYCDLLGAACTGPLGQLPPGASCAEACAHWPKGDLTDPTGHSVACRQHAAAMALPGPANAAAHCEAAGASGGDACGPACDAYCDLALARCEGLFDDRASCMTACDAYPPGSPGDAAGDSLACRLHALMGPDEGGRCADASPGGGARCTPPPSCETYCAAMETSCTGADIQYFSQEVCLDYCNSGGAFPTGQAGDTSGHSLACRVSHAVLAGSATGAELAELCDIAGPSGGGVCGSACELYCTMAEAHCTGPDTLYAHEEACMTACASIAAEGAFGVQGADTVHCRVASLGIAGSTTGAARTQACQAAALSPEGGCQDGVPSCATTCGAVMAACGDADSLTGQYPDLDACLATCEGRWSPGTYDDTDTDTLGCRLRHARLALEMPATYCEAAGPSGGGVCGDLCEAYCAMAEAQCVGDDAVYGSSEACASICAAMNTSGWSGATDGDTVQCRMTHLGLVAAGGAPADHCPDASPIDGDACVGETSPRPPSEACVTHCATVLDACPGDAAPYADPSACEDACWVGAQLPSGEAGGQGNTQACRADQAAQGDCAAAGLSGGGVCGTWCEVYCHLSQTNCRGDHQLHATTEACMTACALFDTDGAEGALSGDTVQCRIAALGLAGTTPGLYCVGGATDGGGVCVDSPEEQASWTGAIQPLLTAACGACHAGSSADTCPGGGCIASHYDALQLPAYSCPGDTKGDCLLTRATPEDPTHGALALSDQDRATLEAWHNAGLPE